MIDNFEQEVVNISHNDLDGVAAAAVIKKRFPHAKIFHCNYGRDVPNAAFQKGARMYVTDFSMSEMEFKKAENILGSSNIFWLDHHKVNYEPLQNKGANYAGIRRTDACGAKLTWQFLFPSVEIPEAILLTDDYDRWVFAYGDRTRDFQSGISLFETRPGMRNCYIWNELLSDDKEVARKRMEIVITIGRKIREFTTIKNRILCEDLVYRSTWQGVNLMAANTKHANSMFFDSMDKTGVDALGILQYSPDVKKYRCSVYSPDNVKQVVQLAQLYPGGGGHPCAAGFQSPEYPFPRPEIRTPRSMKEVIASYQKILELRKGVMINQSACRSDKISLTSSTFVTSFMDRSCLAINHPYVSELIRNFPATCDVNDPTTGSFYQTLVGFVLVNTGWYRVGCYVVDQETLPTMDQFKADVLKNNPEANDFMVEDQGMLGKIYWFYTKDCPVYLPTKTF